MRLVRVLKEHSCTVRAYRYYVEMIDQNQRHIHNLRAKLHTNVSFRGEIMKKKFLQKSGSTLALIQLWTFVRLTTLSLIQLWTFVRLTTLALIQLWTFVRLTTLALKLVRVLKQHSNWWWETKISLIHNPEVFHFVNGIRKSFTYGVAEYGIQLYSHYEVLFCIRSRIFVFIVDIFKLNVNVNYGTYD